MAAVSPALWERIIRHVVRAGGHIIRPWFAELEPLSLEHGLLEIQAPGARQRDYCQDKALRLFTEAAQTATGRLVGVCFLTRADAAEDFAPADAVLGDGLAESIRLSADYTFDTFVTGPCNRLAHAACVAVSEAPGTAYNPLFVHGHAGLGKTHLLQATCQKVSAADLAAGPICFLSCETFINHFIEAVERGQLNDFRYRYRHAGVLVIDDIQFLSDHERTQEEFFHTFNTLYQAKKQIILSSDRGPGELQNLEERLVSRFNWGLVARLDRPSYETRVAIVRKKARLRGIEMPEDVVCFIAASIESNIRELEGTISKVTMLAQVMGQAIDLTVAEKATGADGEVRRHEVTIEDILSAVMARYNIRLADLQSKKRTRSVTLPRQVCMYLARQLTRHSLEEIGGYFGGRDHSTVLHANRTVEQLLNDDQQFQATVEMLTQQLRAGS